MAQYKVPQDVEADDKLLGPFSFRQFVYLMIAGALIAIAVGLFQLFPLLAIIPLPPVLFFLALALPLKKDQPMETYLAALMSYYTKPRVRTWETGQRGTTIQIMAPKKVEQPRTRNITGEEATHRLSFLADIVDTEGYAIKGINPSGPPMREDLMAEASTAVDMFEGTRFDNLANTIEQEEIERHEAVVRHMQDTIQRTEEELNIGGAGIMRAVSEQESAQAMMGQTMPGATPVGAMAGVDEGFAAAMAATGYSNGGTGSAEAVAATANVEEEIAAKKQKKEKKQSNVVVMPDEDDEVVENSVEKSEKKTEPEKTKAEKDENEKTKMVKASIIELVNNNKDYSIETLAKEAKRIKGKEDGEIFISLH